MNKSFHAVSSAFSVEMLLAWFRWVNLSWKSSWRSNFGRSLVQEVKDNLSLITVSSSFCTKQPLHWIRCQTIVHPLPLKKKSYSVTHNLFISGVVIAAFLLKQYIQPKTPLIRKQYLCFRKRWYATGATCLSNAVISAITKTKFK